ncbi:MAG: S-adenosylmethionine decarboxylase [Dehalococcoidia bacterium]|nr:S-adenosylmethionine decarboxylase [Dehalococcoidia bacterium]
MNALGTQILLELKQCNRELLNDLPLIRKTLLQAAREVGATVIGQSFHQFSPQGVTGVVAIAESHICIHTWPEYGYAAVDIFTCGEGFKPQTAVDLIVRSLGCQEHSVTEIRRGLLSDLASVTAR